MHVLTEQEDDQMSYTETFNVRWADVDANGHMRHSAYYDYCAHMRLMLFKKYDYSLDKMIAAGIGPVLFREEARFYKELALTEAITIDCAIKSMRKSGKIWIFQHQFFNQKNQLAAIIIAEGTWIDLRTRKAVNPPEDFEQLLENLPRTEDFSWLPDKNITSS